MTPPSAAVAVFQTNLFLNDEFKEYDLKLYQLTNTIDINVFVSSYIWICRNFPFLWIFVSKLYIVFLTLNFQKLWIKSI